MTQLAQKMNLCRKPITQKLLELLKSGKKGWFKANVSKSVNVTQGGKAKIFVLILGSIFRKSRCDRMLYFIYPSLKAPVCQ